MYLRVVKKFRLRLEDLFSESELKFTLEAQDMVQRSHNNVNTTHSYQNVPICRACNLFKSICMFSVYVKNSK